MKIRMMKIWRIELSNRYKDTRCRELLERFRDKMRGACPQCEKKTLCMGGCPLMPEIVFCESEKRKTI